MENARKEWREQEAVEKAKQALEEKEEAEAAAQVAAEVAADIAAAAAAAEEEEAAAATAALAQVQLESLAAAAAAAAAGEDDVSLAEANPVEDTSDATVEKPAEHRVKVAVESLEPCEKREEGAAQEEENEKDEKEEEGAAQEEENEKDEKEEEGTAQEEEDEKDEKEEEDGETEQQGVWQDISSPQALEQAQLPFVTPDLNAEAADAVVEASEPVPQSVPQRTPVSPAILAVLNMNRKHKPASTAVEEPMACISHERESVYMFSDDDADDDDVESDDELDSGMDGFVDPSKTWHSYGSNGGSARSVHDEFSGSDDDDDDDDDDIIHPDFIDVLGRASTPSRFRRSSSADMGSTGGDPVPSNAAGAGLAIDTSRYPSPDASTAATTDSSSSSSASRLSTSSPRRANNSSFMRSPRVVQASSLSPKNNHDQSDLMDIIPDRVDLVENGGNPLWQWLTSARDVHEVEI
jgi:hypothetical protein